MPTTHRKKLIEVALPLEAINEASAREKSIRHGHPSTLHLWWARRPLAAARAVIFASLVDDPDSPDALPAFVEACRTLDKGANAALDDTPRMRLFDFIERLVKWESTTDEKVLKTARELIQIATEGNPPPLLDPFAGGGSIPLEAQRLGLEAHASDLNPVAVMINKAQIEIPPRFANMPPVNPRDNALTPQSPLPPQAEERGGNTEGNDDTDRVKPERWHIPPEMRERMTQIARNLRKSSTPSEDILWQAVRNRQLDGKKFKRQVDIGPFVLDFYCPEERLAVEVDGPIHATQVEADRERQRMIESLGIRFVRITSQVVETNIADALNRIRAAFGARRQTVLPLSSRSVGEGAGGEGALWRGAAGLAADVRYYGEWMREKAWEKIGHLYPTHNGETVIAWIWARTVKSPNPAVDAHVPLVRSFILSKKKGKQAWIEPVVEALTPHPQSLPQNEGGGTPLPSSWGKGPGDRGTTHRIRFVIRREQDGDNPHEIEAGTISRSGGRCIVSGSPISYAYIKDEGMGGRIGASLLAIVTDGKSGRSYYSPEKVQEGIADKAQPNWRPDWELSTHPQYMSPPRYGLVKFSDLFSPRQLHALDVLSELVPEARNQVAADYLQTLGHSDVSQSSHKDAADYANSIAVYLAFAVDKVADRNSALTPWASNREHARNSFAMQAMSMAWDFAESNVFSDSSGNFIGGIETIAKALSSITDGTAKPGKSGQVDAAALSFAKRKLINQWC